MADDLGYGDIGPFGQKLIQTPNLDRMAAEGMCFTQFYPGASVCAPSRATLMTGLHTGHTRIRGNRGAAGTERVPLRASDVTVAEVLRQAGYATGAVGKWGLGEPKTEGQPNKKGFDFWFGYLNQDHAENYYPEKLWKNDLEITLLGNKDGKKGQYSNDVFTDEAIGFIEMNRSKPFFLYLAYTIPHAVWAVPNEALREYAGVFAEEEPVLTGKIKTTTPRAMYAAMVTRLDREVGRVLQQLRRLGLDQDTVVFFTSDNGPPDRGGIPQFFGSTGAFRGFKGSLDEGGLRAPMIVRWPGHVAAGKQSDFIWAGWDLLPTAAELAGVIAPGWLDGVSVVSAFTGKSAQREGYLYWEIPAQPFSQAIRIGDLKAIRTDSDEPIKVFNLREDPGEKKDLAASSRAFVTKAEDLFRTARTPSAEWPVADDKDGGARRKHGR